MQKRSYKLDQKRRKKIRWALSEFSLEDCKRMIDACAADKFHMGQNDRQKKYNDLCNHIFKDLAKMEGWLDNGSATRQPTAEEYDAWNKL